MAGFTLTSKGGVFRELLFPSKISLPIQGVIQQNDPRLTDTFALWDTGASASVITKSLAKKIGLQPIAQSRVHHAGGVSMSNVYMVNIYFEPKIVVPNIRITECDDQPNFGMIIGMDIITIGDFAITNFNGTTKFSYRAPSEGYIDFVEDAKKKPVPTQSKPTPLRNDTVEIKHKQTGKIQKGKWKKVRAKCQPNGDWELVKVL